MVSLFERIKGKAERFKDRAATVYRGRVGKLMLACDVTAVVTILVLLFGSLTVGMVLFPLTLAAYVYTLKQIEKADKELS